MSRVHQFKGKRGLHAVDQKYDPADFMIPARDHKGASDRIHLNLQPQHLRALQILANSRHWPFKDRNDVARWCIHVGIKRLEEMEPVNCHTQQVEAAMEIVRETIWQGEYMQFFELTAQAVSTNQAQGDHGQNRQMLSRVLQRLRAMDDSLWKDKYLREFDRRFGHVLDGDEPRRKRKRPRDDEDDDE